MDFAQVALLTALAAVSGAVAKLLRQPLLIGYLLVGLLLALTGIVHDTDVFSGLGQIGVALLLFLVGIEMNVKELPSIGKVALIAGLGQIVFTSVIGFLLASLLGFPPTAALYTAVALTFSSTIIIVKLLGERKDLGSLYGRISIGFLLVQDFVAVLILMFLAGFGETIPSALDVLFIIAKGVLLILLIYILSRKILPKLFDQFLASNQELLFIGSLGWALGLAALVAGPVGFTIEIGGFLAGIALSGLPEHMQIANKTRPVRDFFLTIFFILLGTHLVVPNIGEVLLPAIIFSAFVLIGNPLILLIILGVMGYKRRTSFMAGLTVAQISEFSLILMAMGAGLGHVTGSNVATIIIVAVITMTLSTYLILGADKVFIYLRDPLAFFERKNPTELEQPNFSGFADHVVLVGAHKTGERLLGFLKKKKAQYLVVDFDPYIFSKFARKGVPVLFGDINDPEILELSAVKDAKLVISTISNLPVNLSLLNIISVGRTLSIFTAHTRVEALRYYEAGASYVLIPEEAAGDHIRHILSSYGLTSKRIVEAGKRHGKRLTREL